MIFLLQVSLVNAAVDSKTFSQENIKESIEKQLQLLNAPKPPSVPIKQPVVEGQTNLPPNSSAESEELKKINAEFSLSREKGVVQATIDFDNGVPFYAVYRLEDEWFITLSYATDNTMADWNESEFPEINSVTTVDDEASFSYRLRFNKNVYPKINFDDQNDRLTVIFGPEMTDDGMLASITPPREVGDTFKIRLRNARTDVEVNLKDSNRTLWVICGDDRNKPIAFHQYPEFDLLESYQGAAFLIKSDELDYAYIRKVAEISKIGGLANSYGATSTHSNSKVSIFSDFDPISASQRSKDVLRILVSGDPKIGDGLYLVWLYLGQGLAQESAEMADQLLVQAPDLRILPFWRALRGLASLMRFHYQRSQDFLTFAKGDQEIDCWLNIAEASREAYSNPTNLHKLLQYKDILMLLPVPLRERLRSNILEVGIIHDNKPILMMYGTEMEEPNLAINRPIYEVAKAVCDLDPKKPASGDALKALATNDPAAKPSIFASFKYLKFLRQVKGIDTQEELKQLDRLRYIWRGDLLEYAICKYLIQRYIEEHQYAAALPLLRKTIKYFTKESYTDKLPELMQQVLIDYFKQKSPPVLEMLSIFQEYTSIAPDDERGDGIMIKATNVLVNLELYDQAIDLLKDYLGQKVKSGDNVQRRKDKIYYRMAVASILGNKPEDCLNYLSDIKDASDQIDDIAILRSEAYLRLKKTDQALKSLGNTPVQQFQKASIYFGDKNWADAITIYKEIAEQPGNVPEKIKEDSIINLALCYAIQADHKSLNQVEEKFKGFMEKRKGREVFEFLTAPDTKINLARLTALHQVDSFSDRLKSVFS